jgi:hypothetical protein
MREQMKRIVSTLLALSVLAQAHHGWAEFDEKTEVTYQGTITAFYYVNPHCVVEFDVRDDKGQMRKWQGEFGNPGELKRKGWTAATLETGEKLTITGHPSRNGAPAIHATRIVLSSGREFKLDSRER